MTDQPDSEQSTPQHPAALTVVADVLVRCLRLVRYGYLLRVPIFIGAILFVFPFAALLTSSPLRVLFQNLFLMDGGGLMWPWPTFWSTMAALVLAWSILLTGRIVLLNCGDRFNVPAWMNAADLKGWSFFGILTLSLPAILGQFTQRNDFQPVPGITGQCVLAAIAAALCSYVLAFAALWFAVVLAPPHTQGSALTFPCLPFMRAWLLWADNHHVLPQRLAPGTWIRKNLPCSLWRGYIAGDGFMWSGHWLALLFGSATLGLYFFIGWWHGRSLGNASGVSALTFVLLLLLNANWVLSFGAFFLDRFRIPMLVPLALFALVAGNVRSSDHYFQVQPLVVPIRAVSPGAVLRARADKSIVVIATAGGGIQAAAWTTQVLAGLEVEYEKWRPGKSFSENVTLISSVSGGATGSMFYLSLYDPALPRHFRNAELSNLPALVSMSSLDDVAWALVYHDLPRIFLPFGDKLHDRGYVLEKAWSQQAHLTGGLSEWRKGVEEGWRPAAIFNSTITETGEPLVLSTTAWTREQDPETNREVTPRRQNFYDLYPGIDLRVVTAVRLAATFPFVTPAARPDTQDSDGFHMIDGGYYDNYGISSLIAWLEDGLLELQAACEEKSGNASEKQGCHKAVLPRILVIQIRPFPADAAALPKKRGWAFQLYAPLKGLLSVRSTAQLVRDREALTLFARQWEPREEGTAEPRIQFATFEYGGFSGKQKDKAINPPLSWAMNPSQIQAVKEDWNTRVNSAATGQNDPNVDKVHCFFDSGFERCASLPRKPD
jgi:hypothetical protein